MSQLFIGQRVFDKDGFRGVIRYLGPVATSKSADTVYAGIEWDDSSRGKNDGSVTTSTGENIRYFICRPGGSGSFLKVDLVNTGADFAEVITKKYEAPENEDLNPGVSFGRIDVTFVGRSQKIPKLQIVSLSGSNVNSVTPSSLVSLCPSLQNIDLSNTAIHDWKSVAELGIQLKHLKQLDISDNKFDTLTLDIAQNLVNTLSQVKVLIAARCGLSWAEVECLSLMFPNLEELHITGNNIDAIVSHPLTKAEVLELSPVNFDTFYTDHPSSFIDPSLFSQLHTLSLSDNPLGQWGQVLSLARLPKLANLNIRNVSVSSIFFPFGSVPQYPAHPNTPFLSLDSISAADNIFENTSSIDAIDSLPNLTSLRILYEGVPSVLGEVLEPRQQVIARLPRLQVLNGSAVRAKERDGAEKLIATRVSHLVLQKYSASKSIFDVFGEHSSQEAVNLRPYVTPVSEPTSAENAENFSTLKAGISTGFAKSGGDGGVIRSQPSLDPRCPLINAPFNLFQVSERSARILENEESFMSAEFPDIDFFGLVSEANRTSVEAKKCALALGQYLPRYFLLAAHHDLHSATSAQLQASQRAQSSLVQLTIRSMAGNSSTMEPVSKKLPRAMTVAQIKQLAQALFRADPDLQRVSFRDSPGSFPGLLDDDSRPLSYYGVTDGGEILIEEVDPAVIERERLAEQAAKEKKVKDQAALGDALRRAQEMGR